METKKTEGRSQSVAVHPPLSLPPHTLPLLSLALPLLTSLRREQRDFGRAGQKGPDLAWKRGTEKKTEAPVQGPVPVTLSLSLFSRTTSYERRVVYHSMRIARFLHPDVWMASKARHLHGKLQILLQEKKLTLLRLVFLFLLLLLLLLLLLFLFLLLLLLLRSRE